MGNEEQYIIEYVTLGKSMKVTAIDPVSLKEATIVAPHGASKEESAQLAMRKLRYLLGKDKG